MYADSITASMEKAIDETNRRRVKQIAYNKERGVDPQPLRKKIADITDLITREDADTEELLGGTGRSRSRGRVAGSDMKSKAPTTAKDADGLPGTDLVDLIERLTEQMHTAAAELQFELAARYRDEVSELKKELRQMREAGHA